MISADPLPPSDPTLLVFTPSTSKTVVGAIDPRIVELRSPGSLAVFSNTNKNKGTYKFNLRVTNLRNPVTNLTYIEIPLTVNVKAQSTIWSTLKTQTVDFYPLDGKLRIIMENPNINPLAET